MESEKEKENFYKIIDDKEQHVLDNNAGKQLP
jgi:hypothetical protein